MCEKLWPLPSKHWVKVKNPKARAVKREAEEDWSRLTVQRLLNYRLALRYLWNVPARLESLQELTVIRRESWAPANARQPLAHKR
jgi:hypothetical protein